jgi:hypothetical protein
MTGAIMSTCPSLLRAVLLWRLKGIACVLFGLTNVQTSNLIASRQHLFLVIVVVATAMAAKRVMMFTIAFVTEGSAHRMQNVASVLLSSANGYTFVSHFARLLHSYSAVRLVKRAVETGPQFIQAACQNMVSGSLRQQSMFVMFSA